jgi:SAM-dependent methyltransferase
MAVTSYQRGARRLVIGGGRARDFPRLRPEDISLNIDADARPNVQGDIAGAPFASSSFAEVYFEKVPYDAFSGERPAALGEVARLLQPGGRLVIETGILAPVAEIEAALHRLGFKYLRVRRKAFLRLTCRLGGIR